MSNQPMQPDPADTPGLERGGSVPPGETPPGESGESQAAGRTPAPKDRSTPTALIVVVAAGVVLGALALVWAVLRAMAL